MLEDVFLPFRYRDTGAKHTFGRLETLVVRHTKRLPPLFFVISTPIEASIDYSGFVKIVPYSLLHLRWPIHISARPVVVHVLALVARACPALCSLLQELPVLLECATSPNVLEDLM